MNNANIEERPSVEELTEIFEEKKILFLPTSWVDPEFRGADDSKMIAAWHVYGRINYLPYQCPKCGVQGVFRWGFLGKLSHPDCGASWHVGPLEYVAMRMRKASRGFGKSIKENLFVLALIIFIELPIVLVVFSPVQLVAKLTDPSFDRQRA